MPFSKLKGERPNGMGNSSFDIGICVSRCTEGGRAPGFRGRILRGTGTSRVGGLQVGTLYQEILVAILSGRSGAVTESRTVTTLTSMRVAARKQGTGSVGATGAASSV
ncbi:hypothetical protein HPB50_003659 [Hyalomma asiaticum]|uniref:Uncharacterized protein n=1 Tax=Hyalomma asiaticum TaxID=266040 RepID=A0ACB7TEN4_HYAAI|nr:hypothetical protein HPB50_003659 [Hyalomma asiaticum]